MPTATRATRSLSHWMRTWISTAASFRTSDSGCAGTIAELRNGAAAKAHDLFLASDESYSIVLAYDREDFDARLSYVWRDAFKQDNDAPIFANPLARFSSEEESLDLQLSYYWSDNFVVTLDATNLTDEVFQNNYGGRTQVMNFGSSIFSRTYALGFRASF